jgi:Domain of unknown function (DUF5666)
MHHFSLSPVAHRPLLNTFKALFVAAVLAGCGGGGSGPTGKSSYAVGPITGFGSIIVNGVRYDDSSASVASDDDDNGESRGKSDLKIGMVVEVKGNGADDSGRSSASDIRFGSEIVGPFVKSSVNATDKTFVLLGQKVQVSANTVFDDSLAANWQNLTDGTILEVHGILDSSSGTYNATRIELESSTDRFKLRGKIADLNTTAKTFKIGTAVISYASLSPQPTGLANDQFVRVKLETTQVAGAWVATKLKSGMRKLEDHDEAEIKGTVSDYKSMSDFKVNGTPVDASGASGASSLKDGDFVEVEGRLQAGKLTARKVELEDRIGSASSEFEFHRRIANISSDGSTFKLGELTIVVAENTVFERGATAGNIKDGDCVEVKAVAVSDSTNLRATLIKFDNSCPL